jgi:hypothetical protein
MDEQMQGDTLGQDELTENGDLTQGVAFKVEGAQDITVEQAGAFAIAAGRDVQMTEGAAVAIAVGRNLDLHQGGSGVLVVGGDADINQGGSWMMVSNKVTARDSYFGIAITNKLTLEGESKVLLDTKQSLILGAAAGGVFALLSLLLRRR